MFSIGEFSKIARISTRQLRHYDEVGLFKPMHINPETGYRYYSAHQLKQLNRILALKDLGLALDQIKRLIDDNLTAEELHGMLKLKQAQIEQNLRQEIERAKSIEERIWQIESEGVLSDDDVLLKSIPEQKFLSTRQTFATIRDGFNLIYEIHRLLPSKTDNMPMGLFGVQFHTEDFATENLDVEMGFLLEHEIADRLPLSNDRELTMKTIPTVEAMATVARVGIYNDSVGHYGALGTWIEDHHYQIDGPGWEVFLEPFEEGQENNVAIEIRIPVKPVEPSLFQQLNR